MRLPHSYLAITTKWHLVVNCDKDEWKIMVGNMKNDVSIWMLIKNQVAAYSFHTLGFLNVSMRSIQTYMNIKNGILKLFSIRMKLLES